MKVLMNEQGNILWYALVIVALFAIAYFWQANQPEQREATITSENRGNEEAEVIDQESESDTAPDSVAIEALKSIQNFSNRGNT